MAKEDDTKLEALKRIGGGRWETRDGRFQIEPQSGTWVIVDTTQTNEFGLPLVRGPFSSLTAAKAAIESARDEGPVASPLADRLERTAQTGGSSAKGGSGARKPKAESTDGAEAGAGAGADADVEPEPPPDPAWIRALKPVGRQKARALIERLEALGVDDAEAIARAEVAEGEPALVRLAIRRRIERILADTRSPRTAVSATVDLVVSGEDDELEVGWHLVDDRQREIRRVELEE